MPPPCGRRPVGRQLRSALAAGVPSAFQRVPSALLAVLPLLFIDALLLLLALLFQLAASLLVDVPVLPVAVLLVVLLVVPVAVLLVVLALLSVVRAGRSAALALPSSLLRT
jgi:hypothetical protein